MVAVRSLHRIFSVSSEATTSPWIAQTRKETRWTSDRRWNSHPAASTDADLKTVERPPVDGQESKAETEVHPPSVESNNDVNGPQKTDANAQDAQSTESKAPVETNEDHIPLAYDLPRDWYSPTILPSHRRERLVMHLAEWAKRRILTPKLLLKLLQDPLSPHELSRYTSNNISRIVYAIGLIKKTDRLIGHPSMIEAFLKRLHLEATDRKRLITYDGIGLSQAAFGFSMMKLDDPNMFAPFAEEAIKPHRIRNTLGKCLVNLLDSLHHGGYTNLDHVETISRAAITHVHQLPTFAIPRLINAWGHFKYSNVAHIRAVLNEALIESRLNAFLAIHIQEILEACAKMQFKETNYVTAFVRELIYSQKWKFMSHGSLSRIVWSMGTLQYEYPSHWKQVLEATLDTQLLPTLECNMIVDIYVGWSQVSFRDSPLLDRLGREAVRSERLDVYSTRQMFEIFKAQRLLGQVEKKFNLKLLKRLRDTEKLMKCNIETKIQIALYSNIKLVLGMENVEALMKAICQRMCLEPLDERVLIQLAHRQATLGRNFENCFDAIVKESTKIERLQRMDTQSICRLLGAWLRLGHSDHDALERVMTESSNTERIRSTSVEELVKLIWTMRQLNKDLKMPSLLKEAMQRQPSTFSAKGIAMLLTVVVEQGLHKDEIRPFVEALDEDNAFLEASSSIKTEIVDAVKAIGLDIEASNLQQSGASKRVPSETKE